MICFVSLLPNQAAVVSPVTPFGNTPIVNRLVYYQTEKDGVHANTLREKLVILVDIIRNSYNRINRNVHPSETIAANEQHQGK